MTTVTLDGLSKIYPGAAKPALDSLTLQIASGELTALLGPSGCGKTTTMKIIAGLLQPSAGDVAFDGRSILHDKPEQRGAVMVFQSNLLFPHMSVAENIGFGLKMRRVPKAERQARVSEMLGLVKLPDIGDRRPADLSGGQQQRVALARALIVRPNVLLLDEPLSSLDAHLRAEMRDLIRQLQRATGITTVFVTHDQEEAVVLADQVALLIEGRLLQYAKPDDFYKRPASEAVARFFGSANFVPGHASGGVFQSVLGPLRLAEGTRSGRGTLTFRPESVKIGPGAENSLTARLQDRAYLGTRTRLQLAVADQRIEAVVNPVEAEGLEIGQTLALHLPRAALWVLN